MAIICSCSHFWLIVGFGGITLGGSRSQFSPLVPSTETIAVECLSDIPDQSQNQAHLALHLVFYHSKLFHCLIPRGLVNLLCFIVFFCTLCLVICLYWWLLTRLWSVKPVMPWTTAQQKPYIFDYIFDLQNEIHQKWFTLLLTIAFRNFVLLWFRNKNQNEELSIQFRNWEIEI